MVRFSKIFVCVLTCIFLHIASAGVAHAGEACGAGITIIGIGDGKSIWVPDPTQCVKAIAHGQVPAILSRFPLRWLGGRVHRRIDAGSMRQVQQAIALAFAQVSNEMAGKIPIMVSRMKEKISKAFKIPMACDIVKREWLSKAIEGCPAPDALKEYTDGIMAKCSALTGHPRRLCFALEEGTINALIANCQAVAQSPKMAEFVNAEYSTCQAAWYNNLNGFRPGR
jgi:hypothetical protein